MEDLIAISSVIITSMFFVSIFLISNFALFKLFTNIINNKKEEYAKKLIEEGFSVLTFDKFGIPRLLAKDKVIVNIWYGKKV